MSQPDYGDSHGRVVVDGSPSTIATDRCHGRAGGHASSPRSMIMAAGWLLGGTIGLIGGVAACAIYGPIGIIGPAGLGAIVIKVCQRLTRPSCPHRNICA